MKAAKAIHADDEMAAKRWHEKSRSKLLGDDRGVDNTIDYFGKNQERMRYLEFLAAGLAIGSRPVEAAAKNIVPAHLEPVACGGREKVVSRSSIYAPT